MITKAILPVAGFGTRFLPASKAIPKEMLPIIDKPLVQYAVEEAIEYGVKVTGCTVHIATEEVDAGPILAQESISVFKDDTKETLHERIKEVERRLYIETLQNIIRTEGS